MTLGAGMKMTANCLAMALGAGMLVPRPPPWWS